MIHKSKKKGKKGLYWLPVLLWMFLIFQSSAQPYSQQDLRPLLYQYIPQQTVEHYLGDVKLNYAGSEISIEAKGTPAFIEFFIRKGAHVFVFMVLAILTFWMLQKFGLSVPRSYVIAFLISLLYACGDEWHQSFNPHRSAKWMDVGIDVIGASIGLLWIAVFRAWRVKV